MTELPTKMGIIKELNKKIEKVVEQNLRDDLWNFFIYLKNPIGLNHKISDDQIIKLKELKQIRNLYAHGDGRVNEIFLAKVPKCSFNVGDKYLIDGDKVNDYHLFVYELLSAFDKVVIKANPELSIEDSSIFNL